MSNEIIAELSLKLDKAEAQIAKFSKQTEKDLGFMRLAATNFVGAFTATAAFDLFKTGVQSMAAFMKDSVGAAAEAQTAVNSLNTALAMNGNFSKKTSDDLREFAAEIQRTTKFEDDMVIQNLALLESLTRLDGNGLKKAQSAAIDLSAALGIDLNTATEMVAKAANGNVNAFNKMGIEIKKGSTDVDTFANTLRTLEERFKGAAASEATTFAGATAKLTNNFGELQEQFGDLIVKNPAVIQGMNYLTKVFQMIGKVVEDNKVAIMQFVGNGISLLIQSIPYVIDGVSLMTKAWGGLQFIFDALRHLLGGLAEGLGRIAEFAGLSAESLVEWGEKQQEIALDAAKTDADTMEQRLSTLQTFRDELQIASDERVSNIANIDYAEEQSTAHFDEMSKKRVQIKQEEVKKLTDEDKRRMTFSQQLELKFQETYKQAQTDKVGAFQGAMTSIATLQQSENSKLFRIGQAAAIANAIINTALGVTAAFALGPILGPILAPIVAAAGAVQIGMIASQKPPSSARDGISFIPEDKMTWVASRGERVVGERLNQDLSRFLADQRGSGQGGGINNITINASGVIGNFDDNSRTVLANELIAALEFQNVSRRGVI